MWNTGFPITVEKGPTWVVFTLIGMRTEIVPLCLNEIGGGVGRDATEEIIGSGRHDGKCMAMLQAQANDVGQVQFHFLDF